MTPLLTNYLIPLILIGLIYPLYAIYSGKATREFLLKHPEKKISAYISTLAIQVFLVGLITILMSINRDNLVHIGLEFLSHPLYLILLLIISIAALLIFQRIPLSSKSKRKLSTDYEEVRFILPTTLKQYRTTIGLSFGVGILEEVMFRGFLFWQFSLIMPILPAILLTNTAFAFGHYSTQLKNMISTFFLGLLFSVLYYITGNLWLSILAHIVVDLYAMTMAKRIYIDQPSS